MRAEEVMFRFAVDLLGDSEERKKLGAVVYSVGCRVQVDHSWCDGKYHVVDLISKLGGKGEKWERL